MLDWTKGSIFSSEDKEFMDVVIFDLNKYLKRNIFPSKNVLVFPPFNGFRRFLIHKLIEDSFSSADVAAFSIGKDITRRIVVCYKGLVRTELNIGSSSATKKTSHPIMIETENSSRRKTSPQATMVYRPPAARNPDARKKVSEAIAESSKRVRTRRPDQQVYVPRPKRASLGNDPIRSRSRSSSRTSLDTDSSDKTSNWSRHSRGDMAQCELDGTAVENTEPLKSVVDLPKMTDTTALCSVPYNNPPQTNDVRIVSISCETTGQEPVIDCDIPNESTKLPLELNSSQQQICDSNNCLGISNASGTEVSSDPNSLTKCIDQTSQNTISKVTKLLDVPPTEETALTSIDKQNDLINSESCFDSSEEKTVSSINHDKECGDTVKEKMDIISISSDNTTIFSDSRDSTTNSSMNTRDTTDSESTNYEEMEIDQSGVSDLRNYNKPVQNPKKVSNEGKITNSMERNETILVISDSNSNDSVDSFTEQKPDKIIKADKVKSSTAVKEKSKTPPKKNLDTNPNNLDWESLYDDSGELLDPDLMEELTNAVGKVRVTTADGDYRPYQSEEERTNDGECVIEIYDFPAEFKTTDLMNIFAAYRSKNFQLKWVDDTHALGIFPSPLMADEVLACTLPYVKTRPLRLGISESRSKARNLILPPLPSAERPKTCTALARRLVSGALGLRLPTSRQDRELEKQLLKEAREKRRLEAKQRDAAWEGTLTSSTGS